MATKPAILVVEDDRYINRAIAERLHAEGYAVDAVYDGPAAVAAAAKSRYDAVVLDVMLPGMDGLQVCRTIQADHPVPVLMLTARDSESDRITGLSVGADDYLTKPFSPRELVARLAALLRRVERAAVIARRTQLPSELNLDGLRMDTGSREVTVDQQPIALTRTEFDVLAALLLRGGRVVTREELLSEVWDWAEVGAHAGAAGRAIDSHIKAVRRKIGAHRIRTVHGVGYAIQVPQ